MADQWIFDAPASVNGSTIKGLTLNGGGFDELYCNGKHVAHFSKDVSVTFFRTRFTVKRRFSEVYTKTDSCGYFVGYGRNYYVVLEYYARISVNQNTASPGKRIKQIDWGKYDGKFNHFITGTILEPANYTYEYSTGEQTFCAGSVEDDESIPPEDWSGDIGTEFYLTTAYQKAEMTLTFYDGTKINGSDGHHISGNTRYYVPTTVGANYYGVLNCTLSATK